MLHEVLALAVLVALNPVLLAFTLLVISRPRTVPNLLAFWLGSLMVNVPAFLIALLAMHLVPSFADFAHSLATPDPQTSVRPVQVASGVVALALATVMMVRLRMRDRARQLVAAGVGGDGSPALPEADDPNSVSRPRPLVAVAARVTSAVKRLAGRVRGAWEGGSLWPSVLMGMGYFASLPLIFLVGTIVVASGAPLAAQIGAVVSFVIVMLGALELALLGYVISPEKTQAVLKPVHDWSAANRQQILITLLLVIGIWQLVKGFAIL